MKKRKRKLLRRLAQASLLKMATPVEVASVPATPVEPISLPEKPAEPTNLSDALLSVARKLALTEESTERILKTDLGRDSGAYAMTRALGEARVASGQAKTVEQGVAAVLSSREGADLYQRHLEERRPRREHRLAFVQQLVYGELSPVVKRFQIMSGVSEELAKSEALQAVPGYYALLQGLEDAARQGATVVELEAGHARRVEMVRRLVNSDPGLSVSACINKVLARRRVGP